MKGKPMPPTYFLIFVILSIVCHFLIPVRKFLYPPYTYFGYIFIAFGGILNIWADALFKKTKTTVKPYVKPTVLIVTGPFRISRHPMYLGMAAILVGIGIVHGTISPFVFPVLFVILTEVIFIPLEEGNLERQFGDKFLAYKKRVRRWI